MPQFHQQMCYVIAMRTIECFENALGRRALWAPRFCKIPKPVASDAAAYEIKEQICTSVENSSACSAAKKRLLQPADEVAHARRGGRS